MKRVTGIGGIFFKADNPETLYAWYEKHLGLKRGIPEAVIFPDKTVWAIFPKDTNYFSPSRSSFMINYRVEDLDAVLEGLRVEGVEIAGPEDSSEGRFAWIMDPEGNCIELWQSPPSLNNDSIAK